MVVIRVGLTRLLLQVTKVGGAQPEIYHKCGCPIILNVLCVFGCSRDYGVGEKG